LSIDFIIKS